MRSIQQDMVATPIQAEKRRQAAPKRHVCGWCDVMGGLQTRNVPPPA